MWTSKVLGITLLISLAGCFPELWEIDSPEVVAAAGRVKVSSDRPSGKCVELSEASASRCEADLSAAMDGVKADLRLQAARMGGTHIRIDTNNNTECDYPLDKTKKGREVLLTGTVFKCEEGAGETGAQAPIK